VENSEYKKLDDFLKSVEMLSEHLEIINRKGYTHRIEQFPKHLEIAMEYLPRGIKESS